MFGLGTPNGETYFFMLEKYVSSKCREELLQESIPESLGKLSVP